MAPVNPLEMLMPSVGHANQNVAVTVPKERRRRGRSRVHWPILLFRNQIGEDTVQTITQNLSSQGFYCLSRKPFTVGELLLCKLQIPTNDPGGGESYLECRVQVVRVEENVVNGQYGIACKTLDYRFVAGHSGRIFSAVQFSDRCREKSDHILASWASA